MNYTRKDYMSQGCAHREYYGQFVTEYIKEIVLRHIGSKAFLTARLAEDANLNNIPLRQWDHLAECYKSTLAIQEEENGPRLWSLCTGVCTLKEAARQIVEEGK